MPKPKRNCLPLTFSERIFVTNKFLFLRGKYHEKRYNYQSNVSALETKIEECNSNIEKSQKAVKNAQSELLTLSAVCPQWYIQQYVNNWQLYGSSAAATQAAMNAWNQEYNNKKNQLNNTITTNTALIQSNQSNIVLYSSAIQTLTTNYSIDVNKLQNKYGIT